MHPGGNDLRLGATQSLNDRRAVGRYYTPDQITEVLCRWAIRSASDSILEPSFGGCGFLAAAAARIKELSAPTLIAPAIYGCDIEDIAFNSLSDLCGLYLPTRFLKQDFLTVSPGDFDRQFDVVIGNPPYVSRKDMTDAQRQSHDVAWQALGVGSRHGLWPTFILHSIQFLNRGGRCAWVVPSSITFTRYAEELLDRLAAAFETVRVIPVRGAPFSSEGTNQRVAVLVADNKGSPARSIRVNVSEPVDQSRLCAVVNTRVTATKKSPAFLFRDRFGAWAQEVCAQTFGDIATCQTGTVTGDINYFCLTPSQARLAKLPDSAIKPIVTRASLFSGLRWTEGDFACAAHANKRVWILDSTNLKRSKHLKAYVEAYPEAKRSRALIATRPVWHRLNVNWRSDGFLVFSSRDGLRLTLNDTDSICSNSLYRVQFNVGWPRWKQEFLSLQMISRLGEYWSEIHGRIYNGGALKFEPRDTAKFPVIDPQEGIKERAQSSFLLADRQIREQNWEAARRTADSLVFASIPNSSSAETKSVWEQIKLNLSIERGNRLASRPQSGKR